MSYCPRCGEDVLIDRQCEACGAEFCIDCETDREALSGMCDECCPKRYRDTRTGPVPEFTMKEGDATIHHTEGRNPGGAETLSGRTTNPSQLTSGSPHSLEGRAAK